jgi:hypothetical protein
MSGFFMAGPSTFMAAISSSDNGAGGRTRTGTLDNLRAFNLPDQYSNKKYFLLDKMCPRMYETSLSNLLVK